MKNSQFDGTLRYASADQNFVPVRMSARMRDSRALSLRLLLAAPPDNDDPSSPLRLPIVALIHWDIPLQNNFFKFQRKLTKTAEKFTKFHLFLFFADEHDKQEVES